MLKVIVVASKIIIINYIYYNLLYIVTVNENIKDFFGKNKILLIEFMIKTFIDTYYKKFPFYIFGYLSKYALRKE